MVEWVSWFNHDRLHSSTGDIPPVEFEQLYRAQLEADPPPGSTRPTGSLRRVAVEQPEPLPSSVNLQATEPHNSVSVGLGMGHSNSPRGWTFEGARPCG